MKRRKTRPVRVGGMVIGGKAPVSVQGMAKVSSSDRPRVTRQVASMVRAGAEIVRLAVLNETEAETIGILKKKFSVPLAADIHYNHRLALASLRQGADKIRINPGNISRPGLREIIKEAGSRDIPIRIGINSGSVKIKGSLVESVVASASDTVKFFEDCGFCSLVLSLKTPWVGATVACYEKMAELCDYPFHLGITEAGSGLLAETKSVLGIGLLLAQGIGDTLRVSLTGPPEEEIKLGRAILQALNLRTFQPEIISCPTCGRCQVNLKKVEQIVRRRVEELSRDFPAISKLKIAVMGCSVNGPGEARQADIGIAGGKKRFVLFQKGRILGTYPEAAIVQKLIGSLQTLGNNPRPD